MKNRLFDALKHSTADYADIRIESDEATWLGYRGRELESAGASSTLGGLVRACTRGGWGVVVFDSLDDLPGRVRAACECAKRVGRETTQLAEVEPLDLEAPARLERDFRGVALDEKLRLIAEYNDLILGAGPRIESSRVHYGDSFRTIRFASTRGAWGMEERPRVFCLLGGVARDGALVQRTHESVASTTTYDVVTGLHDRAREAADRAIALLDAPQPEGGPQTVVLDPDMGGVFIHEAFGHLSEADFLYENPRMRDLMTLGREMGPKFLNVLDDGTAPGLLGSMAFDQEGTRPSRTWLIRDGVLASHLHSLETAAKMGEAPTGNARALTRGHAPIVRMTNTFIDNGDADVADVFADVDRGLYACGAFGGQTAFEMFTFSAAWGHRIENGEKGELVRDVTLTGNVFETLRAVDALGNDLRIHQGAGGCGKGGQSPLPVGHGSPHVRIRDVVVGGGSA